MTTVTSTDKRNVVSLQAVRRRDGENTFRFNPREIARVATPLLRLPAPFVLRDTEVPGLALRRQTSDRMTFILERRHNKKLHRISLGEWHPRITPAEIEGFRVKARELLNQIKTGAYSRDAAEVDDKVAALRKMTIADAVEAYVTKSHKSLRSKTIEGYRMAASRVAGIAGLKAKPLSTWTADDVRGGHAALIADGVRSSTASGYMRTLRAIVEGWRNSHPDGMIPVSNVIATGMRIGSDKLWVTAKPRDGHLEPDEFKPFRTAATTLASQAGPSHAGVFRFVELLFLTGLRFREAAALTWSEVNLDRGVLTIGEERMKGKSQFTKPLGRRAVELLREQHAVSGGGIYVFPSPHGPSTHLDDDRYAMGRILAAAGCVTKITPHDLRRTYIRAAEATGLPLSRIQALVHHTHSKGVTAGYIGYGFKGGLVEAAQLVEDFLMGDHA